MNTGQKDRNAFSDMPPPTKFFTEYLKVQKRHSINSNTPRNSDTQSIKKYFTALLNEKRHSRNSNTPRNSKILTDLQDVNRHISNNNTPSQRRNSDRLKLMKLGEAHSLNALEKDLRQGRVGKYTLNAHSHSRAIARALLNADATAKAKSEAKAEVKAKVKLQKEAIINAANAAYAAKLQQRLAEQQHGGYKKAKPKNK